ncbi:MAG: tetratricopeptide repeat protein [Elusimicrobia bacterium]|nr:tetratricopeptide repeat protein [Elusimicrobiota bacterium]
MRRVAAALAVAGALAACSGRRPAARTDRAEPPREPPIAAAPAPAPSSTSTFAGAQAPAERPASPELAAPPARPPKPEARDPRAAYLERLEARDYRGAMLELEEALAGDGALREQAPAEVLKRLAGLVGELGLSTSPLRRAALEAPGEAGQAAHEAIVAYAEGRDLPSVLLASAALGAEPGSEAYRFLLRTLSRRTGFALPEQEAVPRAALAQLKLQRAETAYFEKRYGEAARLCQEALWVDPRNALGWTRLGSARLASGEPGKARDAYRKAFELDPDNGELRRFMASRGWLQSGRQRPATEGTEKASVGPQ